VHFVFAFASFAFLFLILCLGYYRFHGFILCVCFVRFVLFAFVAVVVAFAFVMLPFLRSFSRLRLHSLNPAPSFTCCFVPFRSLPVVTLHSSNIYAVSGYPDTFVSRVAIYSTRLPPRIVILLVDPFVYTLLHLTRMTLPFVFV